MNTGFIRSTKDFSINTLSRVFVVALVFAAFFSAAKAATFTVTSDGDADVCAAGNCTLRGAVTAANQTAGADEINFASSLSGATITLGSVLNVTDDLTINGLGANLLTVSGNEATRIIRLFDNKSLTMRDIAVTKAFSSSDGGAIYASLNNRLLLERVYFHNNVSAGFYGALNLNAISFVIKDSTFENNRAGICGAIGAGNSSGNETSRIINSTFTGNQATFGGQTYAAAICKFGAPLSIENSTVARNFGNGTNGGGVYSNGRLTLSNSIVAENFGSGNCPDICSDNGTVVSNGFNLIGNNSDVETAFPAGFPNAKNDRVGNNTSPLNPQLASIANNGGATRTLALLSNSPAIDAGSNALANAAGLSTDQRGRARFFDGDNNGTATVDIGAFEFITAAPTAGSATVSGKVQSGKRGIAGAIVYLTNANGETRQTRTNSLGYFRFEEVGTGQTYVFNVFSKRFAFQPQVVTVREDITNLEFTVEP